MKALCRPSLDPQQWDVIVAAHIAENNARHAQAHGEGTAPPPPTHDMFQQASPPPQLQRRHENGLRWGAPTPLRPPSVMRAQPDGHPVESRRGLTSRRKLSHICCPTRAQVEKTEMSHEPSLPEQLAALTAEDTPSVDPKPAPPVKTEQPPKDKASGKRKLGSEEQPVPKLEPEEKPATMVGTGDSQADLHKKECPAKFDYVPKPSAKKPKALDVHDFIFEAEEMPEIHSSQLQWLLDNDIDLGLGVGYFMDPARTMGENGKFMAARLRIQVSKETRNNPIFRSFCPDLAAMLDEYAEHSESHCIMISWGSALWSHVDLRILEKGETDITGRDKYRAEKLAGSGPYSELMIGGHTIGACATILKYGVDEKATTKDKAFRRPHPDPKLSTVFEEHARRVGMFCVYSPELHGGCVAGESDGHGGMVVETIDFEAEGPKRVTHSSRADEAEGTVTVSILSKVHRQKLKPLVDGLRIVREQQIAREAPICSERPVAIFPTNQVEPVCSTRDGKLETKNCTVPHINWDWLAKHAPFHKSITDRFKLDNNGGKVAALCGFDESAIGRVHTKPDGTKYVADVGTNGKSNNPTKLLELLADLNLIYPGWKLREFEPEESSRMILSNPFYHTTLKTTTGEGRYRSFPKAEAVAKEAARVESEGRRQPVPKPGGPAPKGYTWNSDDGVWVDAAGMASYKARNSKRRAAKSAPQPSLKEAFAAAGSSSDPLPDESNNDEGYDAEEMHAALAASADTYAAELPADFFDPMEINKVIALSVLDM